MARASTQNRNRSRLGANTAHRAQHLLCQTPEHYGLSHRVDGLSSWIHSAGSWIRSEVAGTAAQVPGSAAQVPETAAQVPGSAAQVAGSAAQLAGPPAQVAGSAARVAGSAAQVAGSAAQVAGSAAQVAQSAAHVTGSAAQRHPPSGPSTLAEHPRRPTRAEFWVISFLGVARIPVTRAPSFEAQAPRSRHLPMTRSAHQPNP